MIEMSGSEQARRARRTNRWIELVEVDIYFQFSVSDPCYLFIVFLRYF